MSNYLVNKTIELSNKYKELKYSINDIENKSLLRRYGKRIEDKNKLVDQNITLNENIQAIYTLKDIYESLENE